MIRIITLAVILGCSFIIFKAFMAFINRNVCSNCDGQGYWEGVRGEKNNCKMCSGTGKKK